MLTWNCRVFAALLLLGLSGKPALSATTNVVRIREILAQTKFIFDPTNITINAGDTIKWTNTVTNPHDTTHNPTNPPRLWASPLLTSTNANNNSFSFTFTNSGFYPYYCFQHVVFLATHPEQTGTVTVVSVPLTVALTNPTNGSTFFAPGSFTIQAAVAGSVAQVEFFRGTTSLGVRTTSPYTNAVSGLAAGAYALSAVATDTQGAKATSGVVNVTVIAPPTITLNLQPASSGTIHFTVNGGSAGQTCVIDASQVLPNWVPILTNKFPNTTCPLCPFIDFSDNTTNLNRRFYRSRVFP